MRITLLKSRKMRLPVGMVHVQAGETVEVMDSWAERLIEAGEARASDTHDGAQADALEVRASTGRRAKKGCRNCPE